MLKYVTLNKINYESWLSLRSQNPPLPRFLLKQVDIYAARNIRGMPVGAATKLDHVGVFEVFAIFRLLIAH